MNQLTKWFPNTLAARLFILASVTALFGVALVAFVISIEYRRNAETSLSELLTANIFHLMGSIHDDDGKLAGQPDLGDVRYSLFDSGWYWSVEKIGSPEITTSSSSLADRKIEVPKDVGFDDTFQKQFETRDRNGDDLQGMEAQVYLGDGNDLYSFKITANKKALNREINRFIQRLAIILVVFALSIVAVIYLVVRLGLKPISLAVHSLGKVRTGEAEQIMGEFPDEIQPLIEETNALITQNNLIVERARTQVGNLAHSLKTPLAVMQNEVSGLAKSKRPLFDEQMEVMRRQVQYYLDRARISARSSTSIASTPVKPALEKLASVVAKLNRDKRVEADLEGVSDVFFSGEEPDLQEIFGNLLENASKYSKEGFEIVGSFDGEWIIIDVNDDGPGMKPVDISKALKRGGRVDEGKTGWGLGLSIVRDLVEEYHGSFQLGTSDMGGLNARIKLPAHIKR